MRPRRLLAAAVYVLVAANLLTLWLVRGQYVSGWDLAPATFGVLALGDGPPGAGAARVLDAVRNQSRPVFTGGESLIYGLVPALLVRLRPWALWGHLLTLVLFVAISLWIVPRLGCRPPLYWACVLASPALVSYAIVAYPYVPSITVPYALAIGWVLSTRQRRRSGWWGAVLDLPVFAAIAAFALNGYEAGKTVFVVPLIAALTVSGVPWLRRVAWVGVAAGLAWLVFALRAGTTQGALAAVPRDPVGIARGLLAFVRGYFLGTSIDYPGLALAALVALPALRTQRLFWAALLAAVMGLVSLNAFSFEENFLTPHRFLLLAFVSVLVVSVALSQAPRWSAPTVVAALLIAGGVAFTTAETVRFARRDLTMESSNWGVTRVYPLPYHRAKLDQHIWPPRVRDALRLVALARQGTEPHLFFYGFSASGEDTVNPQLFLSRLLLPLGYREFDRRMIFVDHMGELYFRFPVRPLADVPQVAAALPTPFFVHVLRPEYGGDAVLATYFNHASVRPVDLGLSDFASYRVEAYAPPGPIPLPPLRGDRPPLLAPDEARNADGFCLTTAQPVAKHEVSLLHWKTSLPERMSQIARHAEEHGGVRRFVEHPDGPVDRESITIAVGYHHNPRDEPVHARLVVAAEDEVAVTVNDRPVIEAMEGRPHTTHAADVLLPPGTSEIRILQHQLWQAGRWSFASTDANGGAVGWRCARDFK